MYDRLIGKHLIYQDIRTACGLGTSKCLNKQILKNSLCMQVQTIPVGKTDLKVQQAKNLAVAQAQQEGCTGNFRSFDSQFGNFLVPVIPTQADLIG